ncbi:MAG: SDR family NAD(P)-dependent oxidoreductase [Chloroflexi bacterium]|nr:SDR family NAD(P)-dependent oxidoreductase [Chloroflexota bacterium]
MNEKFVVVTGASKGIGQATAVRLAKAGFIVFASVRKAADGEALRRENPAIRPLLIDVTDTQSIAEAAVQVRNQVAGSGLYGLVNNAGIAVAAPLEFLPLDDFRKQMEVNLVGQLAVTQAFLACLRQARGRIINVSSIGGRIAGPLMGAYHASKFALEGMSDSLRQQLAPWGMEVVVIEPGAIATPIWETGTQTADDLVNRMSPEVSELYGQQMAAGRSWAEQSAKNGAPADKVAQVIETALTHARPRTRYTVGTDALVGSRIIARLPDRLRDRLMGSR